MIPILETFLSIQGEGYYAGQSAYFIRTQGCDIGCHWCDEPSSWEMNSKNQMSIKELMSSIEEVKTKNIIFTGGEPLMHNLDSVCQEMHAGGYKLHLETSGAYPLSGDWDWITLSPKKIKSPLVDIYELASELKVVIYNKNDFEWAMDQAKRVNPSCLLYLQPEWSKLKDMQSLIIDFINQNPKWNLSLQMHKYLSIK